MARVRIPNMPGVSRASGLPGIDPSAASAPGRAATEMFMELGNLVTRNEIRHKEDIKKGKAEIAAQNAKANKQLKDALAEQQKLIKDRWAVVQRNREEAYISKRNIAKGNIATDLKVAMSQFSNEAATANPDEIMDIQKTYKDLANSQFEEHIKGLRPEDITAFRAAHENNMRVFDVTAANTQNTRIFQRELADAEWTLKTKLYQGTPDAEEEVADAIEVYKRHYKDGWKTEFEKVQAPALYSHLYEKASYADTPDKIKALTEEVKKGMDILGSGYEYNLFTKLRANLVNYNKEIVRIDNQFLRAAKRGEELDTDLIDEYIAADKMTEARKDELVKMASQAKDKKMEDIIVRTWMSNSWRKFEDKIEKEFPTLWTDEDPEITIGQLEKLEEFINKESESPAVRNFMKGQAIAKLGVAVATPDWSLFSRHMGEEIEERVASEEIRPAAIQSFRDLAFELNKFVASSRSDIALSEMMTKTEEMVAAHYSKNMSMGSDTFDSILEQAKEIGAGVEVSQALEDIAPQAQTEAQPQTTTYVEGQTGTVDGKPWIFRNGEWVPLEQ